MSNPTVRLGRPPFLDRPTAIRVSIPEKLREWIFYEMARTGKSEAHIIREALEFYRREHPPALPE